MKTIAYTGKSVNLRVRARWYRPSDGARMILVGRTLYRAPATGDYERAFRGGDDKIKSYVKRHKFRIVADNCDAFTRPEVFSLNSAGIPRGVKKFENSNQVDGARVGPDRFLTSTNAGRILLECVGRSQPASALLESKGGRVAYLRLLASHRRRVRRSGWLGSQEGRPPIDAPPRVPPRKRGGCRLRPETRLAMLPDWLHVSYCASCRLLLRCVEQPERPAKMDRVLRRKVNRVPLETRLEDRPYCPKCVPSQTRSA